MKIIPLSEGSFTIDHSKRFVPFKTDKDKLQERSKGSLLVEVQPFLVITSRDFLLMDTGLGFTQSDGTLQLHHTIIEAGFNPMDVTKILLTHLHKDHAGGAVIKDQILNRYQLSFPAADYYLQQKELDFAFEKGFPSYIPEELEILRTTDKLTLVNGSGTIDDYIHYEISGGHCPYHQVFLIKENDEIIFFGGDEAPQLHQMKSRFVAKYDHDGKKAMKLRQQWWQQGKNEGWTFLFYHDIAKPFVKNVNRES